MAQDVHFTLVNPPNDQPWTGTVGITQDANGYVWIQAFEGLYKYDGHQYVVYQHEVSNANSISSNFIVSAFADKDGMMWFGTLGAGLNRFDPVTNKFTHYRHNLNDATSLTNDTVSAIHRDSKGILWVGTHGGLDEFDPKTGGFKHFAHHDKVQGTLSCTQVRKIYEDREGTIWIGTGQAFPRAADRDKGGLNKLNRETGRFTSYMHDENDPHSLIDNRVNTIFEDSRGVFWVGTAGDGLHTMDRKTGRFERHLYDPAHPEKLSRPPLKNPLTFSDDHITFINEDISGKIWIGTFENGIKIYDPATQKTVWYGTDPKCDVKLNRNEFVHAFRTRDGVLWVEPYGGVELYRVIPYDIKLPYHHIGAAVVHFAEDFDHTIWMTTARGLLHKKSNNAIDTFLVDKSKPWLNKLFNLEEDSQHKLWVTNWQGLYKFDPQTRSFTAYYHQEGNPNSLINNGVMYLKKSNPGKLWVGTLTGLQLMDTKTGAFKNFVNNPKDTTSISNNLIQCIAINKNGDVWVSTDAGINKLDKKTGHFKRYLVNITTRSLLFDSKGNLWAGSDLGLYQYDQDKDSFINFGKYRTAIFCIAEDHENNFWLTTNYGLVKLDLQNQETNIFGKKHGLTSDVNFDYTLHNGEVLAGDNSGYFAFFPNKVLHSTPAPIVVINSFFLGDIPVLPGPGSVLHRPVSATQKISLNHNQSTFSFGFTSIDFTAEEAVGQTSYMLENYDTKWRTESLDEIANYYNVPPGDYIFKVKSINSNGLASEKRVLITISPPWWTTWWAYTIFASAFAGSIWAFIHYRSLQLIREKRVLEQKVHARTEEVMQQKEEIEAQRDNLEKAFKDLKETQTQLVQREKMASLGELTAGIAHEIQNPLNFVNNFSDVNREMLEELKAESKKPKAERDEQLEIDLINDLIENEEKINHHGKRADFIVKGMLQHSRTGTGERQPTDINILANEFFKLSYQGLRAKDKSFNAELLTNFDEGLPKISVVQQDIGRVLLNLFNNAFYAVNQKQKTAGADYKPEVTVTTLTDNGQVVIKVKDNGVGIPDVVKEKIMQPFFTTKPTGEGTGLGLSLTYDMVVKGHGGIIQVESEEGKGSEFIIKLPILTQS